VAPNTSNEIIHPPSLAQKQSSAHASWFIPLPAGTRGRLLDPCSGEGKIARYLASQYERLTVLRFPDGEYQRFKLILLLAIRRDKYNVPTNEEIESIQCLAESGPPPLGFASEPVYPLPTHYSQTWQHMPDYGAYHAAFIADPALPGKWQSGEEVVYLLIFEGELLDGSTPETQARQMLTSRLVETLPIPILDDWDESLWESGQIENLIIGLETGGDCQQGYLVQLTVPKWKEVVVRLLTEQKIRISAT
jgi:hypothetical protein